MSSVTSSGVMDSAGQQASRLALLVKLFQTTGKPAQDSKKSPAQGAAPPPPPPPPPPAQANSAAGLASMFEALQSPDTNSVSNLLSRLLQAVDSNGDGTISSDELQAVTELTSGAQPGISPPSLHSALIGQASGTGNGLPAAPGPASGTVSGSAGREVTSVDADSDGTLSQREFDQFEATLRNPDAGAVDPARNATTAAGPTMSAYEALFQALQLVFVQANTASGTTGSQRYTDALQSLAQAG